MLSRYETEYDKKCIIKKIGITSTSGKYEEYF